MYRLSAIIEEMYNKYARLAERRDVRFNLDFPDMTKRIERPSLVRKPLDSALEGAISRAEKQVSLKVTENTIVVRDDGVALLPDALAEIREAFENIEAKTRVGFGTEIRIKFV